MLKHLYRSKIGSVGICGVDIYERAGRWTVVITELNSNPGVSVTSCYQELATDLAQGLMDIGVVEDPRSILWIEHYEGASSPAAPWFGATWDEVIMPWDGRRFGTPRWKPCARGRFRRPALGRAVQPHEIAL